MDAADVVGEQLASLFDVGIDDGEELLRSLELGRVSLGGGGAGEKVQFIRAGTSAECRSSRHGRCLPCPSFWRRLVGMTGF